MILSDPKMTRISYRLLFCLSLLGFTLDPCLQAQMTTGNIVGTVKDSSDAVMPGVSVRVTNLETGITRASATGTRGEYRILNLSPGRYEVQGSMEGFQTSIHRGITLSIGRDAVVNFTLLVGEVAEQVTVTGEAPLIETTTASVSGLVDPQQMRNIPLNARSFLELVPMQAGVVFAESGGRDISTGFGKKLSIAGTRYRENSFLLDGADINNVSRTAGSAAGTVAGVETVREFRVITNAYDAEYGRHTGGVISAVTKSGTNEFHGSLFEFMRNNILDARNFFDVEIPPYRRNQFGGSVGGPIRKEKTFIFGSYEGLRERLGLTLTSTVPGLGMRNGILRGAFIGVSPDVRPYLESYPVPNNPDRSDGTALYIASFTQPTDQNFGTVRVDHRFSDADSMFGRFTIDDAEQLTPLASGMNTGARAGSGSRFFTAEESHIYSPALLGRTHFSFNRTSLSLFDIGMEGYVFPKFSFSDVADVPGDITISGLTHWGGSNTLPKVHIQNMYQFKHDVFYTRGRHSLKFGGEGLRIQFNQRSDARTGGGFTFASLEDFLNDDPSSAFFQQPGSDGIRHWRQNVTGLYIQDDISLRQGLSLNMGIRYEFISVPTETDGKVANIRNFSVPHLFTVRPDQTDVGDPYFLNPSLRNFAPRIGLAWDPFQAGKTSIRAGVGMYYDQLMAYNLMQSGVRLAPFFSTTQLLRERIIIDFPNAFATQKGAIAGSGAVPQAEGFQWNAEQPKVLKWSFDAEQQIAADTTVGMGYSGTRGLHLVRGNIRLNSTPSEIRNGRRYILITQPLPNPYWSRMRWQITDGASQYHAFRLTTNKHFRHGFQFQGAYTFSKSTDDSSTYSGSGEFSEADRTGYFGEKEWGLSSFDVRHNLNTSFFYELPWRNIPGAFGKILGGWSLSGIVRLNSGNPFNLIADQPRMGSFQYREISGPSSLDLVPEGDQNPVRPQNPDQYFDVDQFSFPTPFFLGNLGRNVTSSPGIANVDATLMKDTAISSLGENASVQFRAEFFNLFNRPNFGLPALNLFDRNGNRFSNAGEIETTRTSSRQIQLALRLVF
jgi:hypothetical protein